MMKLDQPLSQSNDQPSWISTLPQRPASAFRAFRQFNGVPDLAKTLQFKPDQHSSPPDPSLSLDSPKDIPAALSSVKQRIGRSTLSFFAGEKMPDKVARALGEDRLIDVKEVIESFEFFQRVRHRVSRPDIVDLCCGHGLVGMLFALLERRVERVYLLDVQFPESSARIEAALNAIWPWVSPKIIRLKRSVRGAAQELPQGAGVVAVHACGARTDWSIEEALQLKGPLAVMPCCYTHQVYQGPETLKRHLGVTLCVDVQRTLALSERGYQVDWQEIPSAITPKNRIIAATPPLTEP